MQDYQPAQYVWTPPTPVPRTGGRRWLLIGGLALAFAVMLGVGVVLGATYLATAQAAGASPGTTFNQQAPGAFGRGFAGPGAAGATGQCQTLTVSSVSGSTITAKAQDGSTVTIHTTASTTYTQNGQTATASAVKAGVTISVMGTHNSDGSITATSIDVR